MARRALLAYLLFLGIVVFLLGVVTAVQVVRAKNDVRTAVNELNEVRSHLSFDALQNDSGRIVAQLRSARGNLDSARSHLDTPWLAPVRAIPFVGRQLRSAATLAEASGLLVDSTARTVDEVALTLRDAGPERIVSTVDHLRKTVDRFRADLAAISLPPERELVGPLRDADRQMTEILATARERADAASQVLAVVRSFVGGDGPRRFFLGLNNNAEMRGAGGATLSYGILTFDQGRFRLEAVKPTESFKLTPDTAASISAPEGFSGAFGWLSPTREPRNTSASAIFPQVGPLLAEMFRTSTGVEVDGVITVDVVTLQDLVSVVGSIDVPEIGQTLTGRNTVELLLSEIYARFADDNDARRGALGKAAAMVAARLSDGGYPYAALVQRLSEAVRERRLMIWSARPDEQAVFERQGIAGGFPKDRFPILAAVQNISANKLDYYVKVAQDLDVSLHGRDVTGTLKVTISNTTPSTGLPQYVVGPNEGLDLPAGTYRAFVTVWLPAGFRLEEVGGDVVELHRGTDAGYTLSTAFVDVPAGASRTASVGFRALLAETQTRAPLTLLPQGRLDQGPATVTARLGPGWTGPERIEGRLEAPISAFWEWRAAEI